MVNAQILVVEDEKIVAKDIQNWLRSFGYTVPVIVSTGEEALKKAEEILPDLVVMDIMLSGSMDGVETARLIRERFDIPVVYLSAFADDSTLERAKLTEPFGYIHKPFEERELYTTIEMALYKHKMERRLKESEQWFATTLRCIGDAVIATNRERVITFMNPVAEILTGWRQEDALGRNLPAVLQILDGEGRPLIESHFEESIRTGSSVSLADCSLSSREGIKISVDTNAAPIKDSKGNIAGVVLVLRDITQRNLAVEEQLRLQAAVENAAKEWRVTIDAVESLILILDLEGRVTRLNRSAKELSRVSYKEIFGRRVSEIGKHQPWKKTAELLKQVRETRSPTSCQVQDETSGKTWEIAANLLFLGQQKDDERIIIVARDITQMVELQESLRRSETMAAMGALVGGVAHQVRNPLFGMSATLDAFEARFEDQEEYRRYTSNLRRELNRLTELMQDLLEYGKPHSLELSKGKIEDVVAQVIHSCAPLAEQLKIKLANCVRAGLAQIPMDRRRLMQVFQNLLENAIQHSTPGEIVLVEAAEVRQKDQVWIECAIKDSGPGFQPEEISKIFEPFFSKRRGGTGLGLSIAQRIVEEHGGKIVAANRPEGGAVMTVRLPCNRQ
jgi:PAS domain S-box-containing protein